MPDLKPSQGEIDLYFWHYCMGLLDAANVAPTREHVSVANLMALVDKHCRHLFEQYQKGPSFLIQFSIDQYTYHFRIRKL